MRTENIFKTKLLENDDATINITFFCPDTLCVLHNTSVFLCFLSYDSYHAFWVNMTTVFGVSILVTTYSEYSKQTLLCNKHNVSNLAGPCSDNLQLELFLCRPSVNSSVPFVHSRQVCLLPVDGFLGLWFLFEIFVSFSLSLWTS